MANKKWSQLTSGSALDGTEYGRMVQGGLDRKYTFNDVVTFLGSSGIKTPGKYRFTGGFETQAWSGATNTSYTMGSGSLRAFPWLVQDAITIIAFQTRVITPQASAKFRLGIYTNTAGTNYPGSLVAGSDAQEYDSSTNGQKDSSAVSITLNPGLYWVANLSNNGSVTLEAFNSASSVPLGFPSTGIGVSDTPRNRWLVAQSYGAMPSNFPGSATLAASQYPIVGFKMA